MSDRDRAQLEALGAVPLTNDYTLLKVPKRHARRAELAVVLAELAEAMGIIQVESDQIAWVYAYRQHEWWMRCGLASRGFGGPEYPGSHSPLEAARLALAHVRARG